jgi:hypothetical protein
MDLTTEYLVIIEKLSSEALYTFCDSTEEFKKLLQTDSDIVIEQDTLRFRKDLQVVYSTVMGWVEGRDQRFFRCRIRLSALEEQVENYAALLRSIRTTVARSGGQIETLQDDLSFYYAEKSYPLIHRAETLMRKLIAYFMLTHVGKDWVTESTPATVREALEKSRRKQYSDLLHQVDFIHLADFLFRPYQTRDLSELFSTLDATGAANDLDLDALRTYKPRSNWERYFRAVVDCSDQYLDKKWKQLYELRCMVAHNAIVGRTEYDRITELVNDVSVHLERAIDNLDKVHVPEAERERVAENAATNVNALWGEFIRLWASFERTLSSLALRSPDVGQRARARGTVPLLRELHAAELINDEVFAEALELAQVRNLLVHEAGPALSEPELSLYLARLRELASFVRPSWKDEVAAALRALGGKADLQQVYQYIEANTSRGLPTDWHASIRYVLQTFSSDTESYRGGEDIFRHIGTGQWALRSTNDQQPEDS